MRDFAPNIVETIREPFLILDGDLRVMKANRPFCNLAGIEPQGAEGKLLFELSGGQWQIPKLKSLLDSILVSDVHFEGYEVAHDFPGLGPRIILFNARRISDPKSNQVTILLAFEDITQRRQAEIALRQLNDDLEHRVSERTAQLKAANEELEAFSYSVSHDLRAPLRAMDGFSRILLDDFGPQVPADAQRYLRMVRDATQQMGHLVDDLLAFSRLGRQAVQLTTVGPASIARQAFDGLQHMCVNRQVELVVGDLPPCRADPKLVKQIYINLLSNAIKFTSRRPDAKIEVGSRAKAQDPTQNLYFVRDNGVGFDMKYAQKLFGVFQRLHRAEDYEGTGVGLAIVQRAIHRQGGRVWAEGEVDKGAVVYFTLEGVAA